MNDKQKGYKYYLKRCEEIEFAYDLFDYDAEIGSDITYNEIITLLEDDLFSNLEKIELLKLKDTMEKQQSEYEKQQKELQDRKNSNNNKELTKLFDKPKIMAVVGDVNTGKSMLLYHILETLGKKSTFKLFTYGLRLNYKKAQQIFSVAEMEQITDSLIIVDELSSLFDLDNRKVKKQIENSLRLINHNNNILILCGTPENFKKFLSAKINIVFYKKCTVADFINGNRIKNILIGYRGNERGSEMLNLRVNEVICFDGNHYSKNIVPYYRKYDSKKKNVQIFVPKKVRKNVRKTGVKNETKRKTQQIL